MALHNASEELIACTKAIATHSLGQPMKILLVHSGLPPSAGLVSGLKGFSTGVCLLPAAPGTEHYASSLETCSCASRITPLSSEDPQWLSSSLTGTGQEMKPECRKRVPWLTAPQRLFQCCSTLGSQQVLPAFWHTVRHGWCRLFWMHLSLQPSYQTFCQEGCFPVECRTATIPRNQGRHITRSRVYPETLTLILGTFRKQTASNNSMLTKEQRFYQVDHF